MADAPIQADPASGFASQEATRLELNRQKNKPGWFKSKMLPGLAAGALAFGSAPAPAEDGMDRQSETAGARSAALDRAIAREAPERRLKSLFQRDLGSRHAREEAASDQASAGLAQDAGGETRAAQPSRTDNPSDAETIETRAKQMIGQRIVKGFWSSLWMSFGHSVFLLDLVFFAGSSSRFFRQYIPEIGKEWFTPAAAKRMPSAAVLPIKYGEIAALVVLTFLVLLLDLSILAIIGYVVAMVMSITK